MLYVHVPFCHQKCTYCAFYSRPLRDKALLAEYVDALLHEMEMRCGEQAHPVRTVYFGGGTPSLLPVGELARVVDGLHHCFDLSQVEEVTLEANPEDLTPDYLSSLRRLGFNRLSIGVQSLDDQVLRMLNRRHTAGQALAAVEAARRAGFQNISVDFIFGLPEVGDRKSEVGGDISYLIAPTSDLITHVSAYALTVEPGTALAVQVEQGRVTLPDEDEVVRQYHALHAAFEAAGFRQYEVSNYARPGYESKHNSRYWNRTPYLGLGPGAHSFILSADGSTPVARGGKRRWNHPDLGEYISSLTSHSGSASYFSQETLTPTDAYNELLMTSLRTVRGLPLAAVPEEHRERLHRQMQPYIDCGWIKLSTASYRPTPEGLLHADGMVASLFI